MTIPFSELLRGGAGARNVQTSAENILGLTGDVLGDDGRAPGNTDILRSTMARYLDNPDRPAASFGETVGHIFGNRPSPTGTVGEILLGTMFAGVRNAVGGPPAGYLADQQVLGAAKGAADSVDTLPPADGPGDAVFALTTSVFSRALTRTWVPVQPRGDAGTVCCVCMDEPPAHPVVTSCRHVLCATCLLAVVTRGRGSCRCPMCREPLPSRTVVVAVEEILGALRAIVSAGLVTHWWLLRDHRASAGLVAGHAHHALVDAATVDTLERARALRDRVRITLALPCLDGEKSGVVRFGADTAETADAVVALDGAVTDTGHDILTLRRVALPVLIGRLAQMVSLSPFAVAAAWTRRESAEAMAVGTLTGMVGARFATATDLVDPHLLWVLWCGLNTTSS
jgi:hypothetical protein